MTTPPITLHLPEDIHQRLQSVAQATHQPLEEVVFQAIQGNLPPSIEDAPADLRDEFAGLQDATDETLWVIARESLPKDQWRRHQQLLSKNKTGGLNEVERQELGRLREMADHLVLRRSYALALLKWRGHSLPAF